MLKRKSASRKGKEPNPSKVAGQGDTSESSDRWYEFVRTLRTYYDHLCVAFPHIEEIPKYYSEDWGESFRVKARNFVQSEDMSSGRKMLVGVGYGTPKWDRFVERSPDEVSQAIDYLLENEALITVKGTATGVEAEGSGDDTGGTQPTEEIEKDGPTAEESATSADEIEEDEQGLDDDDLGLEDEPARALKFLEEKHSELEEELESVKQWFEEAKKDARDLQGQLDDEKRQTKTLEDQIRRAEEAKGGKGGHRKRAGGDAGKVQASSEMASRLQEYEQTIIQNEKILATLQEQSETDRQQCEEFKESLQREKKARHQFETELNEERQQLKEQIKRIGEVLAGGEEIPSIEEFEQMEEDELLDYIEDVEKEKQRALAGLEAMDVQEETYQKQLKVQQEEMDTIQDDLERFKGSNLATEMEDMSGTVQKQRSQLETLMGFSKNLKAQINI